MVDENKYQVDGKVDAGERLASTEIEQIIKRFMVALKVNSASKLASKLNISPQAISGAKQRGEIPPGWFQKIADISGFSYDWLRFGDGPRLRAGYVVEMPHVDERSLRNKSDDYDLHGGWSPRDINEFAGVEKGQGFGYAVEKLSRIFSSKNKAFIRAINANLDVFTEAIDSKENERLAKEGERLALKKIDDLASRLRIIEQQLHEIGPTVVARRKQERRKKDIEVECNRRSGSDRRSAPDRRSKT